MFIFQEFSGNLVHADGKTTRLRVVGGSPVVSRREVVPEGGQHSDSGTNTGVFTRTLLSPFIRIEKKKNLLGSFVSVLVCISEVFLFVFNAFSVECTYRCLFTTSPIHKKKEEGSVVKSRGVIQTTRRIPRNTRGDQDGKA